MDVEKIRQDFPVLQKKFGGKPLIYFDNACQSLRPRQVIDEINRYYNEFPACGGRSMHKLGKRVTEEMIIARAAVAKFFGAKKPEEIVFTRNTTEAINLVANSLGFKEGDVVLTTDKEHNSNLIPWQMLANSKGIKRVITKSGKDNTFSMENFQKAMSKNVKLVSMVHTSNLDGTTIPAKEIIKIAHENGALVLLDAAQSAPHKDLNAKKLDVDFFAASGHKMLGPSGMGILYGKYNLLENMTPFITGGDTVIDTTYTSAKFEKPPAKFEAGLQDYAGMMGFAAAVQYLNNVGIENIERHEIELNKKLTEGIINLPGLSIIGPQDASLRGGITSFNINGMDPHEIAMIMDQAANIAIRSGAHCVHSWFNEHNMKGSARSSLYLYNTKEEVDIFIENLGKIVKFLKL